MNPLAMDRYGNIVECSCSKGGKCKNLDHIAHQKSRESIEVFIDRCSTILIPVSGERVKDNTPFGTSKLGDALVLSNCIEHKLCAVRMHYGLEHLVYSTDEEVQLAIAKLGYGLDILVDSKFPIVRLEVARHDGNLRYLAFDADVRVREEVAKRCSGAETLVHDPSASVRRIIAYNGRHLRELINDPDPTVREAVAQNGYGLDILCNDSNEYVRAAVASFGYNTEKFLNDPNVEVRCSLARSGKALDLLVMDEDESVRSIARDVMNEMQSNHKNVELKNFDQDGVVRNRFFKAHPEFKVYSGTIDVECDFPETMERITRAYTRDFGDFSIVIANEASGCEDWLLNEREKEGTDELDFILVVEKETGIFFVLSKIIGSELEI